MRERRNIAADRRRYVALYAAGLLIRARVPVHPRMNRRRSDATDHSA